MTGRRRADHARPVECYCETCRPEPAWFKILLAAGFICFGLWVFVVLVSSLGAPA